MTENIIFLFLFIYLSIDSYINSDDKWCVIYIFGILIYILNIINEKI